MYVFLLCFDILNDSDEIIDTHIEDYCFFDFDEYKGELYYYKNKIGDILFTTGNGDEFGKLADIVTNDY